MKNPLTRAATPTAEQAMYAALAANPDIASPLAALTKAVERFESIRSKLHDETIEAAAVEREASARAALVKTQAFLEIDQATVKDVEAARAEHAAAKEALDGLAGRKDVVAGELLRVQGEVAEAYDDLRDEFDQWRAGVQRAAVETAKEGLRLILASIAATNAAGNDYPAYPRYRLDIGKAIEDLQIYIPEARPSVQTAPVALSAFNAIRRAERATSETIAVAKPAPAPTGPAIAPTYRAPAPPMTDSLSLGDPIGRSRPN